MYITNRTHRYGLVLLILHDINDIILEFGKMFIYSEYRKVGGSSEVININT